MKIAMVQMNSHIGNFEQNYQKILKYTNQAIDKGADLILFPELALCGYPPIDLLDKPAFHRMHNQYLQLLEKNLNPQIGVILGAVRDKNYNSAFFFYKGQFKFQDKTLLPTYDVFDESRYFIPSNKWETFMFKGEKVFITICEDIWDGYEFNPYEKVNGFDIMVNISASPFEMRKIKKRQELVSEISKKYQCFTFYVNSCGANDELIFDGRSIVTNQKGELVFLGESFQENIYLIDTNNTEIIQGIKEDAEAILFQALSIGIKDYFKKTGFTKAVVGLSGGIDSAIVAALAVDALGIENVTGILMPGPYSTEHSVKDALQLSENLGIAHFIISIKDAYQTMLATLSSVFKDKAFDITEENLQARLRGITLMAYSNKFNALVLNTGNKSEFSVGYSTLYGDMVGALAVIGDVYKTQIYKLAEYINRDKEIIPINIIKKAPSAELKPDQKDQDSLPPYDVLDNILISYIEENKPPEDIAKQHRYDMHLINEVIWKIFKAEYKRRQAPIVLKVSYKAFGSGRRIPVSGAFR